MPRGCARFGGGPAEKRWGHLPAALQVAQAVSEAAQAVRGHPRWARPRWEGPLRRLGSVAESAAAGVPGPRCGGAESRPLEPLEALEARVALGRRAVSPASGSPRVPASVEDACRRGSVRGGGECEYV